jgi:hypothetical protein
MLTTELMFRNVASRRGRTLGLPAGCRGLNAEQQSRLRGSTPADHSSYEGEKDDLGDVGSVGLTQSLAGCGVEQV